MAGWMGLAASPVTSWADGFGVVLDWTAMANGVEIHWSSESLTSAEPFVHYEFQVQHSTHLQTWENAAELIPGGFLGSASVPHVFQLATTNAQDFVRLSYRLNMPGADLSGLDLSGADLRGANLAGANLSGTILDGALLGGADLTGANLSGATFAGANLQDVNLDGFDLATFDLSTILGTPMLTHVTANPAGSAADLVPHFPYNADGRDLVGTDPVVPGVVSTRNAMMMLRTNATVGQLNALLAAHNASIVASNPKDSTLPNATLMVRFPTANAQELYDLTVTLNDDPIVEAAAPDVLMGPDAVPADTGTESSWKWDEAGLEAGGNWGLEYARVPQMWNVLEALEKNNAPRIPTCIIDNYFPAAHPDLAFVHLLGSPPLAVADHGPHVAGIVAAIHGNNVGLDGVNPLAYPIGYTFRPMPNEFPLLYLPSAGFEPGRQANAYSMIQDVRDALRLVPETRIINMSLGYNWYLTTNSIRPTIDSPFTGDQLSHIDFIAAKYGLLMAAVARINSAVLIVTSAGNAGGLTPARVNSPNATAALDFGAANILVVGSHDITGLPSLFSNPGGHVSAPGDDILSASGSGGYTNLSGTSMAAPFVSGVAGFLMSVEPSLTPPTVISLIRANGPNVDAYTSLLEIDQLGGSDKEVLRMILNIDDTSEDGGLRVRVPSASLVRDRLFEEVSGPDYDGLNDEHGDNVIDMSDFRRWRDWLIFGEGMHALNGSATHAKLDGNGNGMVHPHDEMLFHPRGDFNGDAKLDRNSARLVPGWSQALTDLEVLVLSDLWEDPHYENPFALFDLVDSADFHVSATNFYYKRTDITAEAPVAVYDAETDEPLEDGGVIPFAPDSAEHVFTVPTGWTTYLASEPISIGEGTNVMMRSIGDFQIPDSKRGADYVVDLALWEMTAVAETMNPPMKTNDSRPNVKQVEAFIDASDGGTAVDMGKDSIGARAWATNSGTFYAVARAGTLPVPPPDPDMGTTYASAVRWQRSFIKDASLKDPKFLVKPMVLRLGGSGPNGTELEAFAEIIVEMRSYDISPAWQPVFFYHAKILGKSADGSDPPTFRIEFQEGDLPDKTLKLDGTFGAEYRQQKHRGTIDLEDVPDGHSFEVRYRLNAEILGRANDNETLAYIGDPLEYGSGTRMKYGTFGELPDIDTVSLDVEGNGVVSYDSHTNFYYRLYRGADADTTGLPIAMKLGIEGPDMLIDPAPPPNATPDDYTLENQPVDQPLDLDADGIDDVYELRHPAILNPLAAADALLDPDGDERSNLREYLDGTDPEVADDPPNDNALDFPGIIVPTYPGGELVDVNNDGLVDSARQNLVIALGHLGGTFGAEISSPLTGLRTVGDAAFLHLDGDAFLDAALTDSLTNQVFLFRGVGDGTFTSLTNHPAISGATIIARGKLNGDTQEDLALFSRNGRGASLHVNNGDGTLTEIATLTTNAFGTARGLALGDLNQDQIDDVIVGYAFNAVVFLSQAPGAYHPGVPYAVGSSPEYIEAADLNQDGLLDVVTANRSTGDISVLLGAADGTLLPETRYPVGDLPLGMQLADLNGDTFLDAVVSWPSADYQTILPGLGNGTFGPSYTVPTGTALAAIHDWDGDGILDFVSTASQIGGIVNLGRGDGTFETRLQIVPPNAAPSVIRMVDLDGDNRRELVGLTAQTSSIDVWEHAAVTGTEQLLSSLVVEPSIHLFTHGDFNGDGWIDLVVATETNRFVANSDNRLLVLTNQGNFNFAEAARYPLEVEATLLVSGDFDGDGNADLVSQTGVFGGPYRFHTFLGDGSGGFQTNAPPPVGDTYSHVIPVRLDGDSSDELVVQGTREIGGVTTNFLEVLAWDGASGWTIRQSLDFTSRPDLVQLAQANGDDFQDLIVARSDPFTGVATLSMFPGGAAGFMAEELITDELDYSTFNSLVADVNDDGLLDVISHSTLFLANPSGGFHPAQTVFSGRLGAQEVADFNNDGKADLRSGLGILLQE